MAFQIRVDSGFGATVLVLSATQPVQAAEPIRVYLAPTKIPVSEFVEPGASDYEPKLRDTVEDLRRS